MIALLVFAGTAAAWDHTGLAWSDADFPIGYHTNDDGFGECLVGAPGGQCALAASDAFAAWSDGTCTGFGGTELGTLAPSSLYEDWGDGVNGIAFGVEELEPGVLGVTVVDSSGIAFVRDGRTYYAASEADIWLTADGGWVSEAAIDAGQCDEGVSVRYVLAHEIGHLAGLGHSCDEGEACSAELRGALMNWTAAACESDYAPRPDDVAGLEALYGPGASFACGTNGQEVQIGVVPMTLNCAVSADAPIASASWSFGDGEMGEGSTVTHTWRDEGLYTVRVQVAADDPECGSYETTVERLGYVRVCDAPRAGFKMEHVQGRVYDVLNTTPIDVIGCISAVKWAIYEGDEAKGEPFQTLDTWDFRYEFPEDGTWTVVLNVGGPAGTRASAATLDVVAHAGVGPFGCRHAGSPGLAGVLLLGVLGLRRRR